MQRGHLRPWYRKRAWSKKWELFVCERDMWERWDVQWNEVMLFVEPLSPVLDKLINSKWVNLKSESKSEISTRREIKKKNEIDSHRQWCKIYR